MGKLDGPMAKVARTLVKFGGRPAVLHRPGAGGEYAARSGTITGADTPTQINCHAAISDYLDRQIDGTLIRRGDRRAIVSRLEINATPVANSWTLVENGRTWQILNVRGYTSGEQEAAFELQLRK